MYTLSSFTFFTSIGIPKGLELIQVMYSDWKFSYLFYTHWAMDFNSAVVSEHLPCVQATQVLRLFCISLSKDQPLQRTVLNSFGRLLALHRVNDSQVHLLNNNCEILSPSFLLSLKMPLTYNYILCDVELIICLVRCWSSSVYVVCSFGLVF